MRVPRACCPLLNQKHAVKGGIPKQTQRVVLAGRSTPCPGKSFQLFDSWFRLLLLTHTTCSWYLVTSYHQVHANKQQLLLLG